MRRIAACGLVVASAVCVFAARAEEIAFDLDPARTEIRFTLAATLHTVRGSFRLRNGAIRYDPATGKAEGEAVVDLTAGATGNAGRDNKMHQEVLESARFPEAVFAPNRVEGRFSAEATSELQVHGVLRIHGAEHEIILSARVETKGAGWTATLQGELPYTQWGMKNPSTLFLRVSDKVQLEIRASGRNLHAIAERPAPESTK